MIGRLTGELVQCAPGELVLDVRGVGYVLKIPVSTFYALSGRSAGPVTLHVHTHVREDALQLFGFATPEERSAFERLIAISGVGPRLGLAVLSGIDSAELDRAVETSDRARLERIPGVGRKTAERILLELRGKVERDSRSVRRAAPPAGVQANGATRWEATSALLNLGYAQDSADRVVEAAIAELGADSPLEDVLKRALRGLLR